MSGAMRKMGVYLGLLEDTDRFDEGYGSVADYDENGRGPSDAARNESARPAPVSSISERRRPTGGGPAGGASAAPAGPPPVGRRRSEMLETGAGRALSFRAASEGPRPFSS